MSYRTSRSFERVNWTLVIEFEAYLLDYIEKLETECDYRTQQVKELYLQIGDLESKLESADLRAMYSDERTLER